MSKPCCWAMAQAPRAADLSASQDALAFRESKSPTTARPDASYSSLPVACSAVGRTPARPAKQSSPDIGIWPLLRVPPAHDASPQGARDTASGSSANLDLVRSGASLPSVTPREEPYQLRFAERHQHLPWSRPPGSEPPEGRCVGPTCCMGKPRSCMLARSGVVCEPRDSGVGGDGDGTNRDDRGWSGVCEARQEVRDRARCGAALERGHHGDGIG